MTDYIDRQKLLKDIEKYHLSDGKFQHWVEVQPSIDAQPVVLCKYCKHFDMAKNGVNGFCFIHGIPFDAYDYCSFGEKEDDTE